MQQRLVLTVVVFVHLLACSSSSPEPEMVTTLPPTLGLAQLTLEQRGLLRATIRLDGILPESPLAISSDLSKVSGRFVLSLPGGKAGSDTPRRST